MVLLDTEKRVKLGILLISILDIYVTVHSLESYLSIPVNEQGISTVLINLFGTIWPFVEGRTVYIVPALVLLTSIGINFRNKKIYCLSLFLSILAMIKLIEQDIRFFIIWYPYSNNLINAFQDHILYHLREYGVFFVFCKFQILRHIVVILLICIILHFLITKTVVTKRPL